MVNVEFAVEFIYLTDLEERMVALGTESAFYVVFPKANDVAGRALFLEISDMNGEFLDGVVSDLFVFVRDVVVDRGPVGFG